MKSILNQSTIVKSTQGLIPGLKGVKGGKKQAWTNANLDNIAAMADIFDFDTLCQLLNMKADTLASALRRAESHHRPLVTKADKAAASAEIANNNAKLALQELSAQAEVIESLAKEHNETKENLVKYFELQAQASAMMAKILSNKQIHYVKANNSSSYHNIYLVRTNTKSARLSNFNLKSRGRLLLSTPGSSQLPGQVVKRNRKQRQPSYRQGRWPIV